MKTSTVSVLFVFVCFSSTLSLRIRRQAEEVPQEDNDLSAIGNNQATEIETAEEIEEVLTEAPASNEDEVVDSTDNVVPESDDDVSESESESDETDTTTNDFKITGMNIGLFKVMQGINQKLMFNSNFTNVEPLIKVLVLSFKIEKYGGEVYPPNKALMKNIAYLYPESLKEAIRSLA